MKILACSEYNENGYLIYSVNFVGAYVRGRTKEEAEAKFAKEIKEYNAWLGLDADVDTDVSVKIIESKLSSLNICDADSDIIFESERTKLSRSEYDYLKSLAIKSAYDFMQLYDSFPNKNISSSKARKTFYGDVPDTAEKIYIHTKNVNSYYFGEIGVDASNEPDIVSCRIDGFKKLEKNSDFLLNKVYDGSYGELWSLKKALRRFIWHDRIHAKAMFRLANRLDYEVDNPFKFEL